MNRNKSFYYTVFSMAMVVICTIFLFYSYFNKTMNIQSVVRNTMGIMFFTGSILFEQFYKNRKLLYIGYFLFFFSICLSLAFLIILKSIRITSFVYIAGSVYMFYKINKYVYNINDKIFLTILSKIVLFNEYFKCKLAWIYYKEDNYDAALRILRNCKSNDSYWLAASNYVKTNEYLKAIELYTKILSTDTSERPEILYSRGLVYKGIGNYNEAIKDFTSCINCKKPDPEAYIALGLITDELGDYGKAKEYFAKGKSLDNSLKKDIPDKYI